MALSGNLSGKGNTPDNQNKGAGTNKPASTGNKTTSSSRSGIGTGTNTPIGSGTPNPTSKLSSIDTKQIKAFKTELEEIVKLIESSQNKWQDLNTLNSAFNKGLIRDKSDLLEIIKILTTTGTLQQTYVNVLQQRAKLTQDEIRKIKDLADGEALYGRRISTNRESAENAIKSTLKTEAISKVIYEVTKDTSDVFEDIYETTVNITNSSQELSDTFYDIWDVSKHLKKLSKNLAQNLGPSVDFSKALGHELGDSADAMNHIQRSAQLANSLFIPFENTIKSAGTEIDAIAKNLGSESFNIDGRVNLNYSEAVQASKSVLADLQDDFEEYKAVVSSKLQTNITAQLEILPNYDPETAKQQSKELVNYMIGATAAAQKLVESTDFTGSFEDAFNQILKNAPKNIQDVYAALNKEAQGSLLASAESIKQIDLAIQNFDATINGLAKIETSGLRKQLIGIEVASKGIVDSLKQGSKVLPEWIRTLGGVDNAFIKLEESIQTGLNKALQTATQEGAGFFTISKAFLSEFIPGIGQATQMMGLLLNPFVLIAAAIGGLVALTLKWSAGISEYADEMGVSLTTATELMDVSKQLLTQTDNIGVSQEDINSVLKKQIELYGRLEGGSAAAAIKSVEFAEKLGDAFGVSAGEAYGVVQQFKLLGADDTAAKNISYVLAQSADLMGIPFGDIAKDLAENSEFIAEHFNGLPADAAKALIQVKRLGLSFKGLASAMDKSLDIGSFTQDMTELYIMTQGKGDLSKFFDLRFDPGATAEDRAKAIANAFDDMVASGQANEFTMKKFADSVGIPAEELMRGNKIREMTKRGLLDKKKEEILLKNINKLSDAQLDNADVALATAENFRVEEEFNMLLQKAKLAIMKELVPLFKSMKEFIFENKDALKGVLTIAVSLGKIVAGILKPFVAIAELLTGDIGGAVKMVSSSFSSWQSGLGAIITSLVLLPKIFQTIWSWVSKIGTNIVSWISGVKSLTEPNMPTSGGGGLTGGPTGSYMDPLHVVLANGGRVMPGTGGYTQTDGTGNNRRARGMGESLTGPINPANTQPPVYDSKSKRWRDSSGKFVKAPTFNTVPSAQPTIPNNTPLPPTNTRMRGRIGRFLGNARNMAQTIMGGSYTGYIGAPATQTLNAMPMGGPTGPLNNPMDTGMGPMRPQGSGFLKSTGIGFASMIVSDLSYQLLEEASDNPMIAEAGAYAVDMFTESMLDRIAQRATQQTVQSAVQQTVTNGLTRGIAEQATQQAIETAIERTTTRGLTRGLTQRATQLAVQSGITRTMLSSTTRAAGSALGATGPIAAALGGIASIGQQVWKQTQSDAINAGSVWQDTGNFIAGTGANFVNIVDQMSFGLTKSLWNATGVAIEGIRTDQAEDLRAAYRGMTGEQIGMGDAENQKLINWAIANKGVLAQDDGTSGAIEALEKTISEGTNKFTGTPYSGYPSFGNQMASNMQLQMSSDEGPYTAAYKQQMASTYAPFAHTIPTRPVSTITPPVQDVSNAGTAVNYVTMPAQQEATAVNQTQPPKPLSGNTDMLLKQILQHMQTSANQPIHVQIGDLHLRDINRAMKTYNNK